MEIVRIVHSVYKSVSIFKKCYYTELFIYNTYTDISVQQIHSVSWFYTSREYCFKIFKVILLPKYQTQRNWKCGVDGDFVSFFFFLQSWSQVSYK